MCEGKEVNIENSNLKSQQRRFVCIAGVMPTSLSNVSNISTLEKLFDKEMLHKL